MLEKHKGTYDLTDKGRKWVDPETILKEEINSGSELHKQILAKTIEKLHETNTLVVAPKEREAFDLIAYPVDKGKKHLWDDKARIAYEIQTTARKDKVMLNMAKKDKYGIPITWVACDKDVLESIKQITADKDYYMLVSINE